MSGIGQRHGARAGQTGGNEGRPVWVAKFASRSRVCGSETAAKSRKGWGLIGVLKNKLVAASLSTSWPYRKPHQVSKVQNLWSSRRILVREVDKLDPKLREKDWLVGVALLEFVHVRKAGLAI